MVNGKPRIQRVEVERLAAEGFDRDAPKLRRADKTRGDRTAKPASDDVQPAIMNIKF